MNRSRLAGDLVEKTLCDVFRRLGLECSSPSRLHHLQMKVGHYANDKLMRPITCKVSRILPTDARSFTISSDHDGKHGIVSDVIVHGENGSQVGISCKRNNFSIKHQRPQALGKHLALGEAHALDYKDRYKGITTSFYDECVKNDWRVFRAVPRDDKQDLYRRVNELVKTTIMESTEKQHAHLLNYLVSREDRGYVLHVGLDETEVRLFKYHWGALNSIQSVYWKNREKNSTMIVLDASSLQLNMRLHTASSCISRSISLKYDTTIVDMDKICHELA